MYPCQIETSTWRQVVHVFSSLPETHCQPGAIDNGTLALLNGACILFPEMRPVFEQKSWEPRSYTGHIQRLLHLLPPSKLRSRSASPWKPNFGSAIADVPMSNWNLDMAPGWRCFLLAFLNRAENIANLVPFTMVFPTFLLEQCAWKKHRETGANSKRTG